MARQLDPRIVDILREYGEDPKDTKGVIWDCHGTWVVYHRALERVAARAGITFSKPDILRSERDEAVILVTARMKDREDWDIGEALINVNYRVSGKQSAYVYAMALKRARDRLILKLVGLHGLLYSEEEADSFREGGRAQTAPDAEPGDAREEFIAGCLKTITSKTTGEDLREWWIDADLRTAFIDFDLNGDDVKRLKAALTERLKQIGKATDTPPVAKANGHDRHEEARVQ